ncbi:OmpA family protein [Accumulibacter sp.]|uniref:OmpA/MotB family protein n=1 Tax=Accumulibacter sp. TaxID=2053492 RepID=UPI0025F83335|nr:OmpA family protein [Accumulibacter sp.]MCM8625594.1 OmpA family protein [Accumulibacter sp.]
MTDMMVGMLFIFIIILMAFALNLKKQETELAKTTDRLTEAQETRAQMLRDIRNTLLDRGVDVFIDERNGVLRLPERLLFRRGEFHIEESGRIALESLAKALSATLPCYANAAVLQEATAACPPSKGGRLEAVFIEGHTDDIPFTARTAAGVASNWDLSAARAIAVYHQLLRTAPALASLENDGEGEDRRGQKLIGVSGYAEYRPIAPNIDEPSRAANRRIDLRFLMATPRQEEVERLQRQMGWGQ